MEGRAREGQRKKRERGEGRVWGRGRIAMEGLEKRREVCVGASRKGGGGGGNNDIKANQKISRIEVLWNRGQNRGLF